MTYRVISHQEGQYR